MDGWWIIQTKEIFYTPAVPVSPPLSIIITFIFSNLFHLRQFLFYNSFHFFLSYWVYKYICNGKEIDGKIGWIGLNQKNKENCGGIIFGSDGDTPQFKRKFIRIHVFQSFPLPLSTTSLRGIGGRRSKETSLYFLLYIFTTWFLSSLISIRFFIWVEKILLCMEENQSLYNKEMADFSFSMMGYIFIYIIVFVWIQLYCKVNVKFNFKIIFWWLI